MGQSLEVVTSELRSASARLAEAGQRLQDGLSAVDLSVDQLLGPGWNGGAASAYSEQWDKWHNGAGQVIRGLQAMSESLKASADSYSATDQQAAGAVGSSFHPGSGSSAGPAGASPASTVSATSAQPASSAQTGGSTGDLAEMMGLGEPAAQLGGQLAEGAAQAAGQLAGGLTQAATTIAQGVTGIVQAAQSQSGADATPAGPGSTTGVEHSLALDEQNRDDSERDENDDERDENDGEEADREGDERDGHDGAAPSGSPGLSAPAEMTPAPRTGNPMRFGRLNDAQ
ncbi:WXG100 family type VII secretion target [Mycolicibacterium goodii]|uniref:WXG100 family type VII secretion target n=1 Tax=Mycolicibacterium goodii TaxID=134601 RepID=UPI000C26968E|nr:WXG100 family type VII secretion target [Mycolicibacterium goodii]PJK22750.1 hypothetical protein CSX11_09490 [Mycolicibacterium goodii]